MWWRSTDERQVVNELLDLINKKRVDTKRVALSDQDQGLVKRLLVESYSKFQHDYAGGYYAEIELMEKRWEALCKAAAQQWRLSLGFDDDGEYLPTPDLNDDQLADWIEENWGHGSSGEMLNSSDWFTRSLGLLMEEAVTEYVGYADREELIQTEHWSRPIKTTSRMSDAIKQFVYDLCVTWQEHADAQLRLPKREAGVTNPLIRFVDAGLRPVMGDKTPKSISILILIQDHLRDKILTGSEDTTDDLEPQYHPADFLTPEGWTSGGGHS